MMFLESISSPSLLLLLATHTVIITNAINVCLYNREDLFPCTDHRNKGVTSPGENQYTIHATRLQRDHNTNIVCVKRKEDEIVEDIEDLGVPEVKFLYSPGAELSPPVNYSNQIVVEYNVKCEAGMSAFINFNALDLEPENCFDHGIQKYRCRDYIEINAGREGIREYCGNVPPRQPITVYSGKFTLKMRSSFMNRYPGFRAFVTCFRNDPSEITAPSCTDSKMPPGLEIIKTRRSAFLDVRSTSDLNPVTVTEMEKVIIDTLSDSLFNKSFSDARLRKSSTQWPPASYSQDHPGDIVDLNELIPDALADGQVLTNGVPRSKRTETHNLVARRRRRSSLLSRRQRNEDGQLSSDIVMALAVMNVNACNPIVRMTAKCYLTIAQTF